MLFTFMDMEPRRKAEDALRHSEERFAKSFRLAPVPTFVSNAESGQILDINESFATATGFGAAEAVGRDAVELGLWDRAAERRLAVARRREGGLRNVDIAAHTKDGATLDCLISTETVSIGGQDCVLAVLQDITERRRTERELISAIDVVMQDTSWFSAKVMEKLAALRAPRGANRAAAELADLSDRQQEILGLLCEGLADKQIAARLGLALNTVRNAVSAIYGVLDVHRRGEAIAWAHARGFSGPSAGPRGAGRTAR